MGMPPVDSSTTSPASAPATAATGPTPADPDLTIGDQQRLQAVLSTGLLDTPPEEGFDSLTRLAAKLLGVPVTFITLVDEHRDYYKSEFGLEGKLNERRQLEGRTFCHYAITTAAPLLIEDTLASDIFREVPTVKSLGVRAYAGIPLVTESGHAIGSFCAIDFSPRVWLPLDLDILTECAGSALREIKLRSAVAEAQKQTQIAQEATRSREEVLAIVAHDLRTPLNFIKMATELVAEDPNSEENADLVERMHGAVDLMNLLIADLLEVAKIQAGGMRIEPQPTTVRTLVDDALAMLTPLARRRDIQLVTDAPAGLPDVMADYERILRVFSNLVVNALQIQPVRHGSLCEGGAGRRRGALLRHRQRLRNSGGSVEPHLRSVLAVELSRRAGRRPGSRDREIGRHRPRRNDRSRERSRPGQQLPLRPADRAARCLAARSPRCTAQKAQPALRRAEGVVIPARCAFWRLVARSRGWKGSATLCSASR
jgi:signal transduction histidine kinase